MAAAYFFPFFQVVLFRSGSCTARLLLNKDMPIRVTTMFDQGQPLGQNEFLTHGGKRFIYRRRHYSFISHGYNKIYSHRATEQ